jgi:hypothetical protein
MSLPSNIARPFLYSWHLRLGTVRFHRSVSVSSISFFLAEPWLSPVARLSRGSLACKLLDTILGSSQLKRDPMGHSHRWLDVFFGDFRCFC